METDLKTEKVKINWMAQIKAVEEWVFSKGYNVEYTDKYKTEMGLFDPSAKTIFIHRGVANKQKLFYILLHECGHLLIMNNAKQYRERFPVSFGHPSPNPKSNMIKMAFFEEEVEAWARGISLAKKLKLDVDRMSFERLKTKCLREHARSMFAATECQ